MPKTKYAVSQVPLCWNRSPRAAYPDEAPKIARIETFFDPITHQIKRKKLVSTKKQDQPTEKATMTNWYRKPAIGKGFDYIICRACDQSFYISGPKAIKRVETRRACPYCEHESGQVGEAQSDPDTLTAFCAACDAGVVIPDTLPDGEIITCRNGHRSHVDRIDERISLAPVISATRLPSIAPADRHAPK